MSGTESDSVDSSHLTPCLSKVEPVTRRWHVYSSCKTALVDALFYRDQFIHLPCLVSVMRTLFIIHHACSENSPGDQHLCEREKNQLFCFLGKIVTEATDISFSTVLICCLFFSRNSPGIGRTSLSIISCHSMFK